MVNSNNNKWQTFLVCSLLVVLTVGIYWPVRHYGFVDYDDGDYVFNNPTVKNGLTWWGLAWSFVDVHVSNWHPLTWLSHMLDCELFGLNAGGHHLTNVLFHCANSVLLFLLLRLMTGTFWRSAFAAALFAWHPLRVESVAWISERKDVLSGFLFLLTLLAYAKYVQRQNQFEEKSGTNSAPNRAARTAFNWSLIFFILGLLAKPMLVTLPFVLMLIDLWPLQRVKLENGSLCNLSTVRANCKLLKEKLSFFFLSGLFCLITVLSQKTATTAARAAGMTDRMGNVFAAYLRYLENFFWPHDLTVLYLRREIALQTSIIAALILTSICAIALIGIRRRPFLASGWFWFLGMLVPVIGLVPAGLQSHADRYTYLPAIGLALMLVWGGHALLTQWFAQEKIQNFLGKLLGISALIACLAATHHQLLFWKNTETLMERALKIDPNNYIAHSNLGVYFSKQNRPEEALAHYQRARELDPHPLPGFLQPH